MELSAVALGVRKGAWTEEEDVLLRNCIQKYGEGKWHQVPLRAGLNRCRKSCRLRWLNYLKPNIKRGDFGSDEVDLIIRLHKLLGNRWSLIAGRIPGRTANDVKNYWNTHMKKKLTVPKITGATIIKPRPRTFAKNINWVCPKKLINSPNNIQTEEFDDLSKPPSSSADAVPAADDSNFQWWNNLCVDKEHSETLLISVSELHEPKSDFCNIELSSPTNEIGEFFVQEEGQQGWSDIPNMDIWDLLSSDPAVLM